MDESQVLLQAAFGVALANVERTTMDLAGYISREGRAAKVWQDPAVEEEDFAEDLLRHPGELSDLQASLALVSEVINALWYADGDDPREVRACPGLIAVGPEGLDLARAMNTARVELAKSLAAMEGQVVPLGTEQAPGKPATRPLRDVTLEKFQAKRLHYKQATRAIVTLDDAPEYAGFTWATHCRKISKTTVTEVRKDLIALSKRGDQSLIDPHLMADLQALQYLRDDHPLAYVRPSSVTPKVNLAWTDKDGKIQRILKRSVLPILYVGDALPRKLSPLRPKPQPLADTQELPRTRAKRKNQKEKTTIEEKPFLATLPVHRYLAIGAKVADNS